MRINNKLLPQFCCKIVVKNNLIIALFNLFFEDIALFNLKLLKV